MHYTAKELLDFSNLYKQKPREYVWNGHKACEILVEGTKLNRAKLTEMSPLDRDFTFTAATRGVRRSSNSLFWIPWLKHGPKVAHSKLA